MRREPTEIIPGIWLSGLPKRKEIAAIRPATIIDLTDRERHVVAAAAHSVGAVYLKMPIGYDQRDISHVVNAALEASRPLLIHCFHGRDRAPRVARQLLRAQPGSIVLHDVGRNLNRAIRVAASIGAREISLHRCRPEKGREYDAIKGFALKHLEDFELPSPNINLGTVWLETWGQKTIDHIDWLNVRRIVVGGETNGLPKSGINPDDVVRLPQIGNLCLTVEHALIAGLTAWGG